MDDINYYLILNKLNASLGHSGIPDRSMRGMIRDPWPEKNGRRPLLAAECREIMRRDSA